MSESLLQPPQERLTFDQILQQAELPEPGPDYFEARRRLWLTPRTTPTSSPPSAARQKLENMLSQPNAVHSIDLWNNGLERVWKGLCSGGKLKTRLPMALIVKIVHASWLQDKTWPAGMHAPSSDNEVVDVTTIPSTSVVPSGQQVHQIPSISPVEIVVSPLPCFSSRSSRTNR